MLLISWLYPLTTMHRLFKLCARWQHLYQGHFSFKWEEWVMSCPSLFISTGKRNANTAKKVFLNKIKGAQQRRELKHKKTRFH